MADNPLSAWLQGHSGDEPGPGAADADAEDVGHRAPPDSPDTAAGDLWELTAPRQDPAVPRSAPPARRRYLLVAAAVPWLVVALLAVRPGHNGAQTPLVAATPTPAPAAHGVAGGADDPTASRFAVLAVRAGLSGQHGDERAATYVDDAVATGVERIGNAAVVTVATLLLHGDAAGWRRAEQVTYAVAVEGTEGALSLRAGPWPVAAPSPATATVPAPQARDAVRAVLEAEGWQVTDVRVERDAATPGVLQARLEGTHPLRPGVATSTLWLRDESPPRLLGRIAPASPPAPTAEDPAPATSP